MSDFDLTKVRTVAPACSQVARQLGACARCHYFGSCSMSVSCLPQNKLRLDAFLAARLPTASRARLQMSIKGGLVAVNGRPQVHRAFCCLAPAAAKSGSPGRLQPSSAVYSLTSLCVHPVGWPPG
jgi:hypothetical protein